MIRAIRIWDLLIGLTFASAAILKAWDWSQTLKLLQYLGLTPGLASTSLVLLVGLEVGLGIRMLLPSPGRSMRWFSAILLAGFSGLLVYLVRDTNAPSCGCAGRLSISSSGETDHAFGLFRNGLLLLIGGACALWDYLGKRAIR